MSATDEIVQDLDPKKVLVSELNTRQPTAAEVAELMQSMKTTGQITPAIARPHPVKKGCFELAAGARRRTAADALGILLKTIVREIPDAEFEDMILTDNLQRVDPDPMQELALIKRRIDAGAPPSEIAARYGKSITWVNRRMLLAGLTPEAIAAWRPGLAFSHFTVDMMEYIASLPAEEQNEISDDTYECREVGTLNELIQSHRGRSRDLKDIPWLHEPATFIDGCGPGCNTNTSEGLFPDPDHPCGACINSECFRKRAQKFSDFKLESLLGGRPVTDFVFLRTKGYNRDFSYRGKELKVLVEWEWKDHYTKVSKAGPETVLAIDLGDNDTPQICHLKRAEKVKGSAGSGASTPGKAESREDKLTGRRLALINKELVEFLTKAPVPQEPSILHIVAAFGLSSQRQFCNSKSDHDLAWTSLDSNASENVSPLGYGDSKKRPREEVLWKQVTPILRGRLQFLKNSDLLNPGMRAEMTRTAALVGFDWETRWKETCTVLAPVPKSWGQGIDPMTLKPEKSATTEKEPAAKPEKSAKKAANKAVKPAKKAAKKATKKS